MAENLQRGLQADIDEIIKQWAGINEEAERLTDEAQAKWTEYSQLF